MLKPSGNETLVHFGWWGPSDHSHFQTSCWWSVRGEKPSMEIKGYMPSFTLLNQARKTDEPKKCFWSHGVCCPLPAWGRLACAGNPVVPNRRYLGDLPHSHFSLWFRGHQHQNRGLHQYADSWAHSRPPESELLGVLVSLEHSFLMNYEDEMDSR